MHATQGTPASQRNPRTRNSGSAALARLKSSYGYEEEDEYGRGGDSPALYANEGSDDEEEGGAVVRVI